MVQNLISTNSKFNFPSKLISYTSTCLSPQQELGLIQFDGHAPAAKRVRLDPDITEDGTHEFHIQYNKLVAVCG